MKNCLFIIGPSAHILKDYVPILKYNHTFFGVRHNLDTSAILNVPNATVLPIDICNVKSDFDPILRNLSPFDSIHIIFAAYTSTGLEHNSDLQDIASSLIGNCAHPLYLFSLISDSFPSKIINGVFISSIYAHVAPRPSNYSDANINPLFYGVAKAGAEQGIRWLSMRNPSHCYNSIVLGPMPNSFVQTSSPILASNLISSLPSGKFVEHSELHQAINFILAHNHGSMRGASLYLDGGYTLW